MNGARSPLRPGRAILLAGAAAGVGDTLLAMGMHGVGPVVVYRGVAAGLIGREAALGGGLATTALGLLLHFWIATTAAACYVAASARVRGLVEHAAPCGLAFGVAVYFFMKDVVVPLSAARPIGFTWAGLVGHAVLVGLPIALVARRAVNGTGQGG
ncbi:MAG: hypothetical protein NDJ94_04475 [Vicinamibacteria bacterium]|nr:hypothetical protein [Vicinamibacteria bacterium]